MMKIRAITTVSDWTSFGGCWGKVGVYRIFDYLKVAGITDIYWRVFDGGLAIYPSKVAQVEDKYVYDEWKKQQLYPQLTMSGEMKKAIDFNTFDPIADAVEVAKEFGINLYLWYTIYEDDHGGAFLCKFAKDHPEYWQMDKGGITYRGTLDFFYDEVRKYKLAIVDELLKYKTKGMMLDLVRHNACPSADADGIHRFGYNPEIRERYKKEYGTDPIDLASDDEQWLSFKRDYMTSFIKEIRAKMDATDTCKELSFMLWPVDYATWACIDVPLLTKENAVQMLCGFSLKYSYAPHEILLHHKVLKAQTESDKVKLLPGLCLYNGIYPPNIDDCAKIAEDNGIDELMLYEADKMVKFHSHGTVRAINTGVPNYKRKLQATRVEADDPNQIDWSKIPEYTEFLFSSGKKADPVPTEKTAAQFAYNNNEVIFRFTCFDSKMDVALTPIPEDPSHQYYLDALGSRTHTIYTDGVNVFLDPQLGHQNFYHFSVSPRNDRIQETMVDETWNGKWESTVETDDEKWVCTIRVPFKSVDMKKPEPGDCWGINILRGIRHAEETNIWFFITWNQPRPEELGLMEFV